MLVIVWDAVTGQDLLTLKGHTRRVNSAAFSPDGKRLVSAADDKIVKVWDVETGQELLTLEGHSGHNGVAFSSDGHLLASGGPDGTVKIYDATPLPDKP
jgi:WD40 repeat protein